MTSHNETKKPGLKAAAIVLALIMVFTASITTVFAASLSVGPNSPTNISALSWINLGNVAASDNVYATITLNSSIQATPFFYAQGYNFNVPDDATITGITATVERKQSGTGSSFYDEGVCLVVDGALYTTPNRATGTTWQTTDVVTTFGSSSDLWGRTLTPALVNKSNFGLMYYARKISGSKTAMIDYIGMTVYYTLPDTTPPVIAPQSDMTVEATSANGAKVNFTPTATDNIDPTVTVVCTPASGSQFPLGTTQVTCNATDAAGNTAVPVTFNVTVQDTTAPVITITGDNPMNISQDSTYAEQGAVWTDAVDGTGSAIVGGDTVNTAIPGTYTVTYNQTDAAGNAAVQATRTVNVIPTYTITFDSAGGTPVANITQAFGSTITAPADPTKDGYTFAGWSPAVPSTMPLNGAALTAQWTANEYTITFDSAGGSAVASITQAFGTDVTAPADPTRDGYTFAGWNPAVPSTMPLNGAALSAQWTTNEYTITFDSAGGSAVASITQAFGSTITAPADPTKDGYTFAGWSPAVPSTMPLNGAALSAQWTANEYTITFDSAGGSAVASITQAFGTDVTAPADPTKDGYTFAGWNPAVPAKMPLNGAALSAKWLDANANLASLTVSGIPVAGFSANTLSYTMVVPNSTSGVNITALAESAKAAVTGDTGTRNVAVGQNTFTITVTAESGVSKTYTLTVTRETAPIVKPYVDGKLSDILLTPGAALLQTFSWDRYAYNVNLTETTSSVKITPVRFNSANTMTIDGKRATSMNYTGILATKTRTVKIVVVLNKVKTTYTLYIKRAKSTNADLSKLSVTGGTLSAPFANGTDHYTVTMASTRSTVTFRATKANAYAKVQINNRTTSSRSFYVPNGGSITVTITNKAQAGNSKSWTFTVVRAPRISTFSASPKVAGKPTVQASKPLTFTYSLYGKGGNIKLEVLAPSGWTTLTERATTAGTKRFTWDGTIGGVPLAPGTYTVRLSAAYSALAATPKTLTVIVK